MMRLLAVGAHPDDVEVGCGGLFLDSQGEKGVVVCSDGAGQKMREIETIQAADMMGVSYVRQATFSDASLSADKALVLFIERAISEFVPDLVLTHWPKDSHQDHHVVARAVRAAMRKGGQLVYFESLSSVDFFPNVFREVKDDKLKSDLIGVHESQNAREMIANLTLAEYVGAMLMMRGLQSRRYRYAEAFVPERMMVDWR